MELHAEERAGAGADALTGAIVHVDEPRLPLSGQRFLPHGVAVVLAGDVAAPREQVLHRLVHAAVAVGQLVGVTASSEREDLVPQADAEDGLAVGGQQGTHLPHQRHQVLRVTGAIADDDGVALGGKRREVGVPGCTHHRCSAFEERADHVVFGSRIHQQHLERAALVADNIVWGHETEDLLLHVHRLRRVAAARRVVRGRQEPSLHCPVLAQSPGQRPGIDAGDAGDVLGLEPGAQRAGRGVVAVSIHVGLHHQPLHLDAARLVGAI